MIHYFLLFMTLLVINVPEKIDAQDLVLSISSTPVPDSLLLEHSFDVAILNAQLPVHYVWDFGDDRVSFSSNPVHSYASPGEYRVWLNVIDADGQSGNAIHWVQVRKDVFQQDQQMTYRYLSASHANCMYCDRFKDNIVWIGTQGGLIRVDLKNGFQQYYRNPLPSGHVLDICQMFDKSLWIATTGGLVQFNDLTLEWNTWNKLNSGLTEDSIYALSTSSDLKKLWIGTMGGGIFCWDALEKIWLAYSTNNTEIPTANIWDLAVDNQDNLWAATHRGLIYLNTSTNSLRIFQSENSDLPDNVINVVSNDPHDNIWIGTWNQGIVQFDPETNEWKQYNFNNSPLTDNFVNHLASSPDGHIWIATKENGLLCFDPENMLWKTHQSMLKSNSNQVFSNVIATNENDIVVNVNNALIKMEANGQIQFHTRLIHRHLPDNSVNCLTKSRLGDIWMGFHHNALMRMSPKTNDYQSWTPINSPLTTYEIRCIHEMSGGKIAVGTANGLFIYDTNARQWTVFHTQNSELPHNTVFSIYYDANAYLWVGTMNGIARFYPATFQWQTYATITDIITCIAQTTDGRIWAGTASNGFLEFRQSDESWMRHDLSNSNIPDNHVQSMIGGQNRKLWIGLTSKGFACLDLETNQFEHFHKDNSSLHNNKINVLAESQSGVIWIGTDDQYIYRFHPLTHEWRTVALSQNTSEISSVIDIAIESEDNLWIGTQNNGILHVSWPQVLENPGSVIIVDNALSRFSRHNQNLLIQNIYQTFIENNFRHNDIWLMTPSQEIDFNGDHCADPVIDGFPDHNKIIQSITQWAEERYEQNAPLFVFFLGQWNQNKPDGEPSYLLPANQYLNVSQLHDAISIFEQKTRGQVIIVIDGNGAKESFGHLSSKGRVVILTDSNPLTQENVYSSFLPDFLHHLSVGQSVFQSFTESKHQASSWLYHPANPLLDDNGDLVFNDLDGAFARQIQLPSLQSDMMETVIQDIQISSDTSDTVSITILCNLPLAQIQAELIPLSGGYSPLSIMPLENYRITSYYGSIENSPSGNYELIVMAKDDQGHMIVSEPEIVKIGNQKTGSIFGKVNLMLGMDEISFLNTNASITLINTDNYSIVHSDGTFIMSNIPEGIYEMRVEGPGFSSAISKTIEVSAGGINQLTPINVDIASSWCSLDSDCNGQFDLKDIIYSLQVLINGK